MSFGIKTVIIMLSREHKDRGNEEGKKAEEQLGVAKETKNLSD